MPRPAEDLSGTRFGSLEVLSPSPAGHRLVGMDLLERVRCDCETEYLAFRSNLRSGQTLSCGCRTWKTTRREKIRVWAERRKIADLRTGFRLLSQDDRFLLENLEELLGGYPNYRMLRVQGTISWFGWEFADTKVFENLPTAIRHREMLRRKYRKR